MLPPIKKTFLPPLNFPAPHQAVIFRCYGYVPTDRLARVLGCDEDAVNREAEKLGLSPANERTARLWSEKGYQTTIRNVWFLLPYEQIETLTGFSETELDYILKEEDFFSVKLGWFKPECEEIKYAPLSAEAEKATAKIKEAVMAAKNGREEKPFVFFDGTPDWGVARQKGGERIVHGFLTPCGDPLAENSEEYLPDTLLKAYADGGITGLWMHGVLSTLSPYPFKPSLCRGYEDRRRELNGLIERCKKYGIKVYLYFNEPRCLAESDLGKFSYLAGEKRDGFAALCFEKREVREYLFEAVKDLVSACPDLGGIITITMSEYLTHCRCRKETSCPICKNEPRYKSPAWVNNVFYRAIQASGSKCELIANLWAWAHYMRFTDDDVVKGIETLDKGISVMCVSECELDIGKNGVKNKLKDYSISNPGPSELSKLILSTARKSGHKTYAKIQVNNSWEMSTVPYLPVFDLVAEHLTNLAKENVYDYMLSWTLGGYPSPTLRLCADFAQKRDTFCLSDWYKDVFGKNGERVHEAVKRFCAGFEEFPFSMSCLYYSPKNLGSANLWSVEKNTNASAMVGSSFDDYETWTADYPVDKYIEQFTKLLTLWKSGLDILGPLENNARVREVYNFAKGAFFAFEYDLIHTRYALYKRNLSDNAERLIDLAAEAKRNAKAALDLIYEDGRYGYEASNHYFFNERNMLEKLLNLDNFIDEIKKQKRSQL